MLLGLYRIRVFAHYITPHCATSYNLFATAATVVAGDRRAMRIGANAGEPQRRSLHPKFGRRRQPAARSHAVSSAKTTMTAILWALAISNRCLRRMVYWREKSA
jgi:hypothetical protein